MSTNTATDYMVKNIQVSSDVNKTYKNINNTQSTISNHNDFKQYLKSSDNHKDDRTVDTVKNNKSSNEVDDTSKNDEIDDTSKNDEIDEKLKELEEDSKNNSKDNTNEILQALVELLNKLDISKDTTDTKASTDLKKSQSSILGMTNESSNDKSNVLNQLMELLKSDSTQKNLSQDSLKSMEKILNQLSSKVTDNKETLSGIKDLMTEISKVINNKQNQSGKVLNLEEMLSKNYSQGNNSSSEKENSDSAKSEVSKEDKFLNSLINDNKDNSQDKINLFASRSQFVQGQGVENTKGITIDKATFTSDLVKDIKYMSNNGLKELTVKVNPGNLGEITINLVKEDGLIKANLKANSKETAELISQNLVKIKDELMDQNIKISDVDIELYQDDTTFFSQSEFGNQLSQEQGKNNQSNNVNAVNDDIIEEDNLAENVANNENNLDFLA